MLAVHITNHYLDLQPVMAAAAGHFGKTALLQDFEPAQDNLLYMNSVWVLLVDPDSLAGLLPQLQGAQILQPRPGFRPWTDSFTNLLGILK